MEGTIILLLSLSLAVGILILTTVLVHYLQWRGAGRQEKLPDKVPPSHPSIFHDAVKPLSNMEKKYLLLFMEGKSVEEVSLVMHVEPSSVYTMRYRIKKKFPDNYNLPF